MALGSVDTGVHMPEGWCLLVSVGIWIHCSGVVGCWGQWMLESVCHRVSGCWDLWSWGLCDSGSMALGFVGAGVGVHQGQWVLDLVCAGLGVPWD